MTRVEGGALQRVHDDLERIARRAPSVFDDPEWRRRDNERWLAQREREEALRRTGVDPVARELRGGGWPRTPTGLPTPAALGTATGPPVSVTPPPQEATGATGGNPRTPAASGKRSEEAG